LTTTPVVRIFCLYASICIAIDFTWQITFFVAIMSLDERKRTVCVQPLDNLNDIIQRQSEQWSSFTNKILPKYAKAVTTSPGRSWIITCFFLLTAIAVYFSSLVELKSPIKDLVSSDSYVFRFLSRTDALNLGENAFLQYGVFVWNENPLQFASTNTTLPARGSVGEKNILSSFGQTLLSPVVQRSLVELMTQLSSMKHGGGPVDDWISNFNQWASSHPSYNYFVTKEGFFDGTRSPGAAVAYYAALSSFLLENSHYSNSLLIFPSNSTNSTITLAGTVFSVYLTDTFEIGDKLQAMSNMYSQAEKNPVDAYCFHDGFAKTSFFIGIWPSTATNAAICFCVVSITSIIFLRNVPCILSMLFCLTAIYIELLGLMGFAGVPLNQITTVVLLSSFGLAVDSVAHITHSAHRCLSPSSTVKAEAALREVGGSVFLGGMTSFVGVFPLIFSKAQFFNDFFLLFTFLIGCALVHGFVFTPALMSVFNELKHRNFTGKIPASVSSREVEIR
jgi:hypothetical protein